MQAPLLIDDDRIVIRISRNVFTVKTWLKDQIIGVNLTNITLLVSVLALSLTIKQQQSQMSDTMNQLQIMYSEIKELESNFNNLQTMIAQYGGIPQMIQSSNIVINSTILLNNTVLRLIGEVEIMNTTLTKLYSNNYYNLTTTIETIQSSINILSENTKRNLTIINNVLNIIELEHNQLSSNLSTLQTSIAVIQLNITEMAVNLKTLTTQVNQNVIKGNSDVLQLSKAIQNWGDYQMGNLTNINAQISTRLTQCDVSIQSANPGLGCDQSLQSTGFTGINSGTMKSGWLQTYVEAHQDKDVCMQIMLACK
jgi:chromosome segregation ATPase